MDWVESAAVATRFGAPHLMQKTSRVALGAFDARSSRI